MEADDAQTACSNDVKRVPVLAVVVPSAVYVVLLAHMKHCSGGLDRDAICFKHCKEGVQHAVVSVHKCFNARPGLE